MRAPLIVALLLSIAAGRALAADLSDVRLGSLRRLADPDNDQRPLAVVSAGREVTQPVLAGGRRRLAVLVGADAAGATGRAVLALYDDASAPKRLDAADVGLPMPTTFAAPAQLTLRRGDAALILHGEHTDPDLKLEDYLVVATIGDRLRTIASFRLASMFVCGWTRIETASFATRPDPGRAYQRIDVTVRAVDTHPPGDCGPGGVPQAGTKLYLARFRWDAGRRRYQAANAELTRLAYDNERLFK